MKGRREFKLENNPGDFYVIISTVISLGLYEPVESNRIYYRFHVSIHQMKLNSPTLKRGNGQVTKLLVSLANLKVWELAEAGCGS